MKNIKHRKEYEAELDSLPDYRLTCFFVDKRYRRPRRLGPGAPGRTGPDRQGWRRRGGGLSPGHRRQEVTASFLYSVTRSLFEQAGFSYVRAKGQDHTVMRTTIDPAR